MNSGMRGMHHAMAAREEQAEQFIPKCTTSGTLEKQLRETVRIFQAGGSPDFLKRQIESYYRLVCQLAAMYAAEIEGRKDVTA